MLFRSPRLIYNASARHHHQMIIMDVNAEKVAATTTILLEALDRLRATSTSQPAETSTSHQPGSSSSSRPPQTRGPPAHTMSSDPKSRLQLTDRELGQMFSWNHGASRLLKGKGKGKAKPSAIGAGKIPTKSWTHSYFCLSSIHDDCIPDATRRTVLKLAGLGEKKNTTTIAFVE